MSSKTPFEHFDPLTGEVPLTAQSLFQQAADMARAHFSDLSSGQIVNMVCQLDGMLSEHFLGDNIADDINESRPDTDDIYQIANKGNDLIAFLGKAGFTGEPTTELARQAPAMDRAELDGFLYCMLLSCIDEAKSDELRLIGAQASYDEIASEMDGHVYNLVEVMYLLRSFDVGMGYAGFKAANKSRSSKGGQAKQQRFAELKEIVIEQYYSKYTHLTPAAAGRAIFGDLVDSPGGRVWLYDDDGNQLIVNEPARFADWIRKEIKTKQS